VSGTSIIPLGRIEQRIFLLRGQKVMLSPHLAELYGVEPKILLQAVKRNAERFPSDFMFQLTRQEVARLRSQIVTLKNLGRGQHIKYLPYAFTEQGVAMLSSVLRSKRAIQVNVEVMRSFVRLRQLLASHADLAAKLEELEKKYDAQFRIVFEAIRQLMSEPVRPRKRIGFSVHERRAAYGVPLSSASRGRSL
jgi:phage regulator Rha-like protein